MRYKATCGEDHYAGGREMKGNKNKNNDVGGGCGEGGELRGEVTPPRCVIHIPFPGHIFLTFTGFFH